MSNKKGVLNDLGSSWTSGALFYTHRGQLEHSYLCLFTDVVNGENRRQPVGTSIALLCSFGALPRDEQLSRRGRPLVLLEDPPVFTIPYANEAASSHWRTHQLAANLKVSESSYNSSLSRVQRYY